MSRVQIFLLVLVAIGLTALMLAFWGSMGSAMCAFLLILMVAALLYRKLVMERDEDMFDWEL